MLDAEYCRESVTSVPVMKLGMSFASEVLDKNAVEPLPRAVYKISDLVKAMARGAGATCSPCIVLSAAKTH